MVQKTEIIVQKKNYTLRTWQTEDVASIGQYLNSKNIWDNCRRQSPILIVRKMLTFFSLWYKRKNIQDFCIEVNGEAVEYRFCTRYGCRTF